MWAEWDCLSVSLKNNNCLTASSAACQCRGSLCWLASAQSPGLWLARHCGGGAIVDDMGAGSLPGRNSLTLIVKGGGRESDRRRGGERRQARGFHDARFGTTCTCLLLRACVCCLEYVVIHMGVVSEAGVIFFFFPHLVRVLAAWASVCLCVCVCVCWPSRRQGVVQLYYHPPTLPPFSLSPCEDHVGVKWQGKGEREKVWEGGEAEEKRALNEWHCLHGHACAAALSLSHAAWRGLNTLHLCSQRRSRPDPTAISVCIVPCDRI